MDYRPEIRPENISLPEENKNSKLLNIGLEMIFFKSDTKAKATKLKINKWGYIKLKSFCTAKDTSNKMKRQPTEWEKHLQIIYLVRG